MRRSIKIVIALVVFMSGCQSVPVVVPGELSSTARLVDQLDGDQNIKDKIRNSLINADKIIANQQTDLKEKEVIIQKETRDAVSFRTLRNIGIIAGGLIILAGGLIAARKFHLI